MTPVQPNHMIHATFARNGVPGVSVAIPVYRLPYANRDCEAAAGGLFRTEDGSWAVAVDARLSAEDAAEQAQGELRRHWAVLEEAFAPLLEGAGQATQAS